MLTYLPKELIQIVFNYLDFKSLKNINPTCKYLGIFTAKTRRKYHPHAVYRMTTEYIIEYLKVLADGSLIYIMSIPGKHMQQVCIKKNGQVVSEYVFKRSYYSFNINQLPNGLIILFLEGLVWSISDDWLLSRISLPKVTCTYGNYIYISNSNEVLGAVRIINMENDKNIFLFISVAHNIDFLIAVIINDHHIISDGKNLNKVSLNGQRIAENNIEGNIQSLLVIEDKIVISTQKFEVMIIDSELRILSSFIYSPRNRDFCIYKLGNCFIIPSAKKIKRVDMTGAVLHTYSNHAVSCGISKPTFNNLCLLTASCDELFATAVNGIHNCIKYWCKFQPNMDLYN